VQQDDVAKARRAPDALSSWRVGDYEFDLDRRVARQLGAPDCGTGMPTALPEKLCQQSKEVWRPSSDSDLLTAAPAATRSHGSGRHLPPPAAKWLTADADEWLEGSPAADGLNRTRAAERSGPSQAAESRGQRGRRNPTNQSSFDQHSRFCVAIERLSSWCSAATRINAFERRLCAYKPGLDAGGWRPTPFRTAIKRWSGVLDSRTPPFLRQRDRKGTLETRRARPASAQTRTDVRRRYSSPKQGANRRVAVGNVAPVTGVMAPLLDECAVAVPLPVPFPIKQRQLLTVDLDMPRAKVQYDPSEGANLRPRRP
jgi:hypothetical protein